MCTLYTFDRSVRDSLLVQIRNDWNLNSDGGFVALADDSGKVFIAVNVVTLNALEHVLALPFLRAFVHLRMATTMHRGITNTHGFKARGGWMVLHNGIVSNNTATEVDSEQIASILAATDSAEATYAALVASSESYANCILLKEDGYFAVFRTGGTGSLYTDGKGSYSTKAVEAAGIDEAVPARTFNGWWTVKEAPKKTYAPRYGTYSSGGYGGSRWSESDWDGSYDSKYGPVPRGSLSPGSKVETVKTEPVKPKVTAKERRRRLRAGKSPNFQAMKMDSFVDFITAHEWEQMANVSEEQWDALTNEQQEWLMKLWSDAEGGGLFRLDETGM